MSITRQSSVCLPQRRRGPRAGRTCWAAVALTWVVLGWVRPAAGQSDEDGLRVLCIQPRQVHHWHELNLHLGALPLNAFVRGLTLGGQYTLHFDQLLAWEIIRAYGIVTEVKTGLNDTLNELELSPTPFEYVRWAATSSFLFTPLYGKLAVVNRTVIFAEIFFVGGVGYGWLTNSQAVVLDAGGGARVFLGEHFSFRLDVRWEGFFLGIKELHNELGVTLGVSVHLG